MFTNNYFKYRKALFENTGCTVTNVAGNSCGTPAFDFGSKLRNAVVGQATVKTDSGKYTTYANPGIYFGTGTTPATADDLTLENFITSGITVSSSSTPSYSRTEDGLWIVQSVYIVTNTTDEPISISEIGFFSETPQVYSSSNKNYEYHPVLFERTVLDEPIVIPAKEAKVITYTINMNYSQK